MALIQDDPIQRHTLRRNHPDDVETAWVWVELLPSQYICRLNNSWSRQMETCIQEEEEEKKKRGMELRKRLFCIYGRDVCLEMQTASLDY